MNYKEIPAFCINLDRRPDRWAKAQEEFDKIGWKVERWPAVQYEKSPYPNMPIGAAGVLDSHRAIWKRALETKIDIVAVFEDDIAFPSDFKKIYFESIKELPPDWKCWHLHTSGIRQCQEFIPIGRYINKLMVHGWGAHGYLLKKSCLEILANYRTRDQQRVDTILTLGLKSTGVQPYGIVPKYTLCFQKGEDTDIKETAQIGYWRKQIKSYWR